MKYLGSDNSRFLREESMRKRSKIIPLIEDIAFRIYQQDFVQRLHR
jgi:hypothetical protein